MVERDSGVESPERISSAQAGDHEAFCELCRMHEARLFRQAMALTRDWALSTELAQDTLIEAWKSIGRYNGECRFFTWLCAIMLNRRRMMLRRLRRSPIVLSSSGDFGRNPEIGSRQEKYEVSRRPDRWLDFQERSLYLKECLDRLPEKHRQVIHLRFYADESLADIGAALNCSVGTIKSRLFHALEKLRKMRIQSFLSED